MKNMKKLLQKAMVFTLTAAMLVGTPLTASAAGLVDLYKIEDQWGNNVDENGNKTDVIHGNSNTGTVTSTGSRTAVLDNEGTILGISLSETRVELELDGAYDGKKEEAALAQGKLTDGNCLLNVSILTDKELPQEEYDALFKSLTWKSSDPNVVSFKNFKDGTSHDKVLSAKAGGDATITVSLDNYAEDIHFKATADVHVKQYASDVKFVFPTNKEGKAIGYVKHTVDLNDVLVKTPATANDDIIFEIVEQKDSAGKVKNSGIAKMKDSSVTYQKTGSVSIVAIPEKAKMVREEITIGEGTPATKVDVKVKGTEVFKKKTLQADKEGVDLELEAVLYTKASGRNPITNRDDCTDDIVWSSKKPAIVDIVGSNKGDSVKLVAKGVGSSAITATASAGKKGTFTVTVKADMTGIEIVSLGGDLYGGQSYELEANTKFGNAPDNFDPKAALKWEIDKNKSFNKGKGAKIKGNVLTLNPQVDVDKTITVTVKSAKKYGGNNITPKDPKEVVFTMKQADVREIIVYEDGIENPLAKTTDKFKDANLKKGITVAAGKNRTLKVVAYDADKHTTIWKDGKDTGIALASTLNWASANTKIATVKRGTESGTVFAGTDKAGKSKITVSGTRLNGSKYVALKTTFDTTVTRPAEWIKISTKANVIKGTGRAQTVKYTVTLPKGTTCKANDVEWMVYKAKVELDANGKPTINREKVTSGKIKGSIKLLAGSYNAGEWLEITATAKDKADKSSVTTSAMIQIVTPSYGVEIRNAETDKPFDKNKTTLAADGVVKISAMVNVGTGKTADKGALWVSPNAVKEGKVAANVTYTVNKKGIIYITNGEIHRIKPGTVKLTATTADGKKASLTIN